MTSTPEQDVFDVALPYEIFEIRTIAVIGGVKLPVAYVGIVHTGEIQQTVAELQGNDPSCDIVLRHCLEAAPSYSVRSMGWAPDQQGAEALQLQLLAEHPLVLNQLDASGRGNSIHSQYLREYSLTQQKTGERLRCAGCDEDKKETEFYKFTKDIPLCKECYIDSVARKVGRLKYIELRRKGQLPPICPPDEIKECNCCGEVKTTAKYFSSNKLIRGGFHPTCKACLAEKKELRIGIEDLRKMKADG